MDYGQFSLTGRLDGEDDYRDLLDQALAHDAVAGNEHILVVLSPHQNNFAMRLTVRALVDAPPDDLQEWQEACEGHLIIDTDAGLIYESPTLQGHAWPILPGRYHVQVCGRGFVSRGWPGSTKPGDEWRVQLWPCQAPEPTRRLKTWKQPGSE